MIEFKIREYAAILKQLYGNTVYLQRILSNVLNEDEQLFITNVINGDDANNRFFAIKHGPKSHAITRAKLRMVDKLDGIILAFAPSSTIPKRVGLKREAHANLTGGILAMSTNRFEIAKHKLHAVIRLSGIPDLADVRVIALQYLIRIAANEANSRDFKKLSEELTSTIATTEELRTLNHLLSQMILANTRLSGRSKKLQSVADKALEVLGRIDFTSANPAIVIAGCPLATAVGQFIGNHEFASTWLKAYREACREVDVWDDSHQRDWLLQQIIINEYFLRKRDTARYINKLLQITKYGTAQWFTLSNVMCSRSLRNRDYYLASTIALNVITHRGFRKQPRFEYRTLITRAGYSAILSGHDELEQAYRRRIRYHQIEKLHFLIIELLASLQRNKFDITFDCCEQILRNLAVETMVTKKQTTLKKQLLRVVRYIHQIEGTAGAVKRNEIAQEMKQYVRDYIAPLAIEMI